MPNPRRYANAADRQAAYRRRKAEAASLPDSADHVDAAQPSAAQPDTDDAPATAAMAPVFAADPGRAVLESIRDNPKAHDADRIRAAQELNRQAQAEALQGSGKSDLVALRETLDLLQPEERLAWLMSEREAHR